MFVRPVIRLEVLAKRIKGVLAATYVAMIVGIVLGSVLVKKELTQVDISGDTSCAAAKKANPSFWGCLEEHISDPTFVTFRTNIRLAPIELFFSSYVSLNGRNASLPPWQVSAAVFLGGGDGDNGTVLLIEGISNGTSVCTAVGKDTVGVLPTCSSVILLSEWDYMYDQAEVYSDYTLDLVFQRKSIWPIRSQVSFHFTYHNKEYRVASQIVRWAFIALTVCVSMWWFKQLWMVGRENILREQWWISAILILLILYNDPSYTFLVGNPTQKLWSLSAVCVLSAKSSLLVFWLLVIDSVPRQHIEKPLTFWLPKLVFGVVMFCASLFAVFYRHKRKDESRNGGYLISVGVLGGCMLIWLYLLVGYVRTAKRILASIPYITSRYRQLALRFFVLQTLLVCVFLIITNVVALAQQPSASGQYFNTVTEVIVISIYVWLMAFVYSPAPKPVRVPQGAEHSSRFGSLLPSNFYFLLPDSLAQIVPAAYFDRLEGFDLHWATALLVFTEQAYFDFPNQDPKTDDAAGVVDIVTPLGFELVKVVTCRRHDAHCFIARRRTASETTIIVSFRGTTSRKNLSVDLRFARVSVGEHLKEAKLHTGFHHAWKALRDDVINTLSECRRQEEQECEERGERERQIVVYCTGHSLGGAIAPLCAYTLTKRYHFDVRVYTFGAPRVGDYMFAKEYDSVVPNTYRLVYEGDFITSIPKFCCMYKHVGIEIYCNRNGNMVLSPSFVEKFFFPRRTGLRDHALANYYGACKKACVIEQTVSKHLKLANPQLSAPLIDTEQLLVDYIPKEVVLSLHTSDSAFSFPLTEEVERTFDAVYVNTSYSSMLEGQEEEDDDDDDQL